MLGTGPALGQQPSDLIFSIIMQFPGKAGVVVREGKQEMQGSRAILVTAVLWVLCRIRDLSKTGG